MSKRMTQADIIRMQIEQYNNENAVSKKRSSVNENDDHFTRVQNATAIGEARRTSVVNKAQAVKEAFLHEALCKLVRESCKNVLNSNRKDAIINNLVSEFVKEETSAKILSQMRRKTNFLSEVSLIVNGSAEKFFKKALATTNRTTRLDKDGYPTIQGMTQEELYPTVSRDPLSEGCSTDTFFEKAYASSRRKVRKDKDGYPTVLGLTQNDFTYSDNKKPEGLIQEAEIGDYEIVFDKDGYPTLDGETRTNFFQDLDSTDIDHIADIVRTRVNGDIEHFITNNMYDKEKIKESLDKTQKKIGNIKAKDDAQEEKIAESFEHQAKQDLYNIKNKRVKSIYESLVSNIANSAYNNEVLRDIYVEGGLLKMDMIMEDAQVMYSFLECLNTAKLVKVDEAFIKNFIDSVK